MPPMLEPEKTSPRQRIIRITLTLLLLYLIFGVLIPSFASYEDVWDALTSLDPVALLFLTALTFVVEGCKAGAFAYIIEPLRFPDAFLAQESAAVISNTVPGPSGTAARYVTYRKFGISTEDFTTSYVVNSSVSNVLPLVMPVDRARPPLDAVRRAGIGLDARPGRPRCVARAARPRHPHHAQRAVRQELRGASGSVPQLAPGDGPQAPW